MYKDVYANIGQFFSLESTFCFFDGTFKNLVPKNFISNFFLFFFTFYIFHDLGFILPLQFRQEYIKSEYFTNS